MVRRDRGCGMAKIDLTQPPSHEQDPPARLDPYFGHCRLVHLLSESELQSDDVGTGFRPSFGSVPRALADGHVDGQI